MLLNIEDVLVVVVVEVEVEDDIDFGVVVGDVDAGVEMVIMMSDDYFMKKYLYTVCYQVQSSKYESIGTCLYCLSLIVSKLVDVFLLTFNSM